jgi:predicted nucleic acid-binding protein
VIERLQTMPISSGQCAYSAVTRMELLGFPQMSLAEEQLIKDTLSQLHYLPITRSIEDRAIQIRRTRCAKLPDALIAATAVEHGLELLTQDMGLQATFVASRTGLSNR